MGGPGGGGGQPFPLVCRAGVGAGSTVRGAARPRRTGGEVDTTTTKLEQMRSLLYYVLDDEGMIHNYS